MRALIIEDEPLISWMLEEVLRDRGISNIEIVTSEAQAIASASQGCPDLIVAEARLAHGDAVGAVEAICADQYIPIVFLTVGESNLNRQFPKAAIVEKPFSLVAFDAALDSVGCGLG